MDNKFKSNFNFFLNSIEKKRKKNIFFLIVILTISSLLEFMTLGTIVPLLSSLLNVGQADLFFLKFINSYSNPENFFSNILFIFIFFIIFSMIFRIIVIKSNEKFSALLATDLSSKIFYKTLIQDYDVIISQNSNNLIAGMTEKITMYAGLVTQLLNLFSSFIISLGILMYLFIYDYKITLITLIFVAITFSIIILISKSYIDKNGQTASNFSEKRFKVVQESINGIRDIILSNSHNLFLNSYKKLESKFRLSIHRLNFVQNSPKLIIEGLGIIILLSVSYVLLNANRGNENEFIINLAVFAFAAQKLLPLINIFYNSWAGFKSYIYVVRDIHLLLSRENNLNNFKTKNIKNIEFKKEIVFKNIDFKYKSNSKNIFNNLKIQIKHNSINGLVGKTGSGKSTFIDLLMGLLKPVKGEIFIDNVKLDTSTIRSWQQKISHVPQNAFLLNSSLRENIIFNNFGNKINEEKLLQVCEDAKINDFLNDLPNGIFTEIGERGSNLSGGQRQRITIARALYLDKPILILDEATNALDYETEDMILNNIKKNYRNKTIVMISHRIDNLKHVENIIDLNDK